jgi:hypothetical protein
LPVPAAVAIIAQAATGLEYAHTKRDDKGRRLDLVHRDISPHNLFVTREGHVRVLDFGIAKSAYQQQRTQSGVLKGKLPYMAPEQARGMEVDGRADQFALGVILWECLTGRRLFARDDPFQTMNSLFHLEAPAPSSLVPGLSPELDRICLTALEKGRDDRFPTMRALADALRAWLRAVSHETEGTIITSALERVIPSKEDVAFYGFDPTTTSTSVRAPNAAGFENIEDEETVLRREEGTPSHSGINPSPVVGPTVLLHKPHAGSKEGAVVPAPTAATASISVTAPLAAAASRPASTAVLVAGGLGLALLFAVVLGIALAVFTGGDDVPPSPKAAAPPPATTEASARAPSSTVFGGRTPIEITFENVPADVVIEVNGAVLESPLLRTVASDDVRAIRALRAGREVWRYDAVFRESTGVVLPAIPGDSARSQRSSSEERPRSGSSSQMATMRAETGSTTAMETSDGRMRLGTDIQLTYP